MAGQSRLSRKEAGLVVRGGATARCGDKVQRVRIQTIRQGGEQLRSVTNEPYLRFFAIDAVGEAIDATG